MKGTGVSGGRMRGSNLPSALEKRDLLNSGDVSRAELVVLGDRFLEAALVHDATDFYAKAEAREAMTELLAPARAEGDVFWYRRLAASLALEPTPQEWLALAEQAEKLGKYRFALRGYHLAGAQEKEERLRDMLNAPVSAALVS